MCVCSIWFEALTILYMYEIGIKLNKENQALVMKTGFSEYMMRIR